jgi:hypothetical protein
MTTKDVSLEISGDASGLVAALATARAAVTESTAAMRSSLSAVTESFKLVGESMVAFTAIMAGGAAFKEVITKTKEITSEAIKLGKSLGVSATEASTYNVAIEQVGGSTEDFADASKGLTRQLKTHEKALNDMGIATRDTNGHLKNAKDLMFDAIAAVNSYKEGTDRNLAAQTAFGRGASATSAIFRLNKEDMAEAAKSAEELGLIIGTEDVQAYKENRKATAEANDVFKGMAKAIGDAVLPVLTQLAEWFRAVGPAAIVVIKGAVGGFVTVFWSLVEVVQLFGAVAIGIFKTVADTIEQLFQAMGHAIQGNFTKAGNDLKNIGTKVKGDWNEVWSTIVADAQVAATKIGNLFADKTPSAAPKQGKDFNLKKTEKEGPDNRLALMKNAYDEMAQLTGDFDKRDIAANLQYWQSILANTVGNSKQDVKLRTDIEKEILALKKKAHDEEIKMEEEAIKTSESLALGEVDVKRQALAQQFALGSISRREEAQGLIALEDEKFRIQQQALQRRLTLAQFDLLAQQKLKDDELKLEQKHALDVQKIMDHEALAQTKTWDTLFAHMSSGFQYTIANFLKGTTSMSGAIRGLFQDVTSSVISSLAQMAAKNIEVMLMSLVMHKTAHLAQVKLDAKAAAAGAYKAVVGIPYVGPFLAPAAAVVAYGATMAFASAEGGYDIPSNVNPMVQTHANEMILPEEHADTIRALSAGGGGGGRGGGGHTFNIQCHNPKDFASWLQQNSTTLMPALSNLNARFFRP